MDTVDNPYRGKPAHRSGEHPALRARRRIAMGAGFLALGVILEIPAVLPTAATASLGVYAVFAAFMAYAAWLFTTRTSNDSKVTLVLAGVLRSLSIAFAIAVATSIRSTVVGGLADALILVGLRLSLSVVGFLFIATRLRDLGRVREARNAGFAFCVALLLLATAATVVLVDTISMSGVLWVAVLLLPFFLTAYALALTEKLRTMLGIASERWWLDPSGLPRARWVLLLRAHDGHAEVLADDRPAEHFAHPDLALSRLLDSGYVPSEQALREKWVKRVPAVAS